MPRFARSVSWVRWVVALGVVAATPRLAWPSLAVAVSYDVVRGDLTELSISSGDFSSATKSCLVDDVTASPVDDPSRTAPRGAGIAASGHGCP